MTAPRENLAVRDLLKRALVRRRVPVTCNFELTLRCNLRCDHCYLGSDRRREELSTIEVCRIIDELAHEGTLLLTLTGGEVLLRSDFADIYRHAISRGFLVSVFSNATLVKPEHVRLFSELPPRVVEISLYGLNDEDYRSFTHASIAFANVDENIRALRDAGVELVLKSVATETLGPKIAAMRAYAGTLGIPFRFSTVVHGANDATPLADAERPSPHTSCTHEAVSDASPWPRQVPLPAMPNRVFVCGAGQVAVHVDPEGFMSRCGMLTTDVAMRTDLRQVSVHEAWERMGLGLDASLPQGHPCRDCGIRSLCSKCPATVGAEQEIAMCELAHERARNSGLVVPAVVPMVTYWKQGPKPILQRRYRG